MAAQQAQGQRMIGDLILDARQIDDLVAHEECDANAQEDAQQEDDEEWVFHVLTGS